MGGEIWIGIKSIVGLNVKSLDYNCVCKNMVLLTVLFSVFVLGFYSCQHHKDQKVENKEYCFFKSYFEDSLTTVSGNDQLSSKCDKIIREEISKTMMPKIQYVYTRDTSEIRQLLDRMKTCHIFDSDPIYYYLKALYFRNNNDALAFENGKRALDLFEIHKDTSGIVNILYQINILNYFRENPNNLEQWDIYDAKLQEWAKKSSNKRDNLLYHKYMLYRDLYDVADTSQSKYLMYTDNYEKGNKIISQDSSLFYEYEYFLSYMCIIEKKFGNIEKSVEYSKKALQLPDPLKHYPTYFNYGGVFDENTELDSAFKYFELGYKEYLKSSNNNSFFEAHYHKTLSRLRYISKEYEEAWEHRRLRDSIDKVNVKIRSEKEINDIHVSTKIELENLKVDQLNTEINYLIISSSILFLFLLPLIYLLYKLRLNKLKIQQNLEFKESVFRMISHDMLSPLHALKGYISILKDDVDGDNNFNIEESLGIVSNNINLLDELAIKTIDYLWKPNKYQEPATLNSVFSISLNVLEIYLTTLDISIKVPSKNNTLDVIIKYPLSIAAIIRNIITNIAKHTSPKEVTVSSKIVLNNLIIEIKENGNLLTQKEIRDLTYLLENNNDENSEIQLGTGLRIVGSKLRKTKSKLEISSCDSGNIYSLIIPL